MTREERLWSMTGNTLLGVAERAGLNVNKNILKQGKAKLIEKILEVENNQANNQVEEKPEPAVEVPQEPVQANKELETKETTNTPAKAPKKANLKLTELTYKGETKSIKEWAAEINMPWPTLYDRVNRNGWSIDVAIETPLGQRRPKNETLA